MKKTKLQKEFFRSFYKGNKLLWAATLVMTILISPINLAFSWLLGEAFDVLTTGDLDRLLTLGRIALLLVLAELLLEGLQYRFRAAFVRRAMTQYKSLAFQKLSEKSISAFAREKTGRYISVLTNDVTTIETEYLQKFFIMIFYALLLAGTIVMMLWYSPLLAAAAIGLSAIPMVISIVMGGELSKREKAVSDQNEMFVSRVRDLLTGFSVIKSFKAETQTQELFDQENQCTETVKFHRRWWEYLLTTLQSGCSGVIQFGIVFMGGFLAIRGDITPGTALVMVNLCNFLIQPLSIIPQYWASWKAARGLICKMAEVTEENATRSGETIEPVLEKAITMKGVCFGYEEGKTVLKDVDLIMEAGKKYAIVGASGSGKSTLLNLLMGAYESYSGSISIDGKELRGIDPNSLYDLMSLIGQNVFLFDNTIRENITMFREFPKAEVDSAVARSGLMPVIDVKGEDYHCGENGVGLSGGERQRISIARSLLRGTPVLMLDEATAALDNQTAFEVTDAILKLDGLTRIVVTHRLEEALLRQYDEILVLRDGRITEQGTYESLMAKTGYFYSLYHVCNP